MRKVVTALLLLAMSLFAQMKNEYISPKIVQSGIKIIDIRTKSEWKGTGVIKNSIPITFFDESGNYDAEEFMKKVNLHVKKGEEFAIVCRSGNRTSMVGDFLVKKGYKVINLQGGIVSLVNQGYKLIPFEK